MAKNTSRDAATSIDDETIVGFGRQIQGAKSDTQSAAQEVSSLYKSFEKQGGHRGAMQVAQRLDSMGIEKATDFMRSLNRYCDVMGLVSGPDMVDQMEAGAANDGKTESKGRAKKAPSKKERVVSIETARAARQLAGDPPTDTPPAAGYAH